MSKRRLLLADDSVTIQKVVNLTFADEGIEVVTVGDGNSAMEKFVEATPDLVMADVNMPGLDGYRICEMIKQDDETKQIPVILLVGSFEPFDEEEARRVGANDYLTKPFQSIRQLVNKVTDLLNAGNGSAENSQAAAAGSFDDTLEFESRAVEMPAEEMPEEEIQEQYGDEGMDDEMIQTSQVGSLPVDEMHKYETGEESYSFSEESEQNELRNPNDTLDASEYEASQSEDWGKTQPLSRNDLEEISPELTEADTARLDEQYLESSNMEDGGENEGDQSQAENEQEFSYENQSAEPEETSAARSAPVFDFDDFDLLGIMPPAQVAQTQTALRETEEPSLQPEIEETPAQSQTGEAAERFEQEEIREERQEEKHEYPPEVIEAIASRVAEKFSDQIAREIARHLSEEKQKH